MGKLSGKVALITGASSGIGAETAMLFAAEGAKVFCVARKPTNRDGINIEQRINAEYPNSATFIMCDITKKKSISAVKNKIEQLTEEKHGIDILFNNAGCLRTGALDEISDEDWDLTYETNLKSILHVCQVFVPILKKNRGVILNNTSINGLHSYVKGKRSYMYASSKAAAIQFTKYLAKNYAPEIRVNALCPGMTETDLFTNRDFSRFSDVNLLGRMAKPEEIAKVALFLCSDDSSFITGSVIVADGGETLK